MANRIEYVIVPADQVQPGDTYKFTPTQGAPIFGHVLAVLPRQNLCQIRGINGGRSAWTYIKPPVGEVTFGRMAEE
jgi:hypothetical protein